MSPLALLVAATAWAVGWLLIGRAHRLDPRRAAAPAPATPAPTLVSIVVPARNEATRLPRLLQALAAAPGHELIIVDDESDDATASTAAAGGAHVVPVGPRPPGWTGKAWACATGAAAASGDVLVFLDADVEPTAAGLAALAGAAVATGGLVSAQPAHRLERPYELVSAGPVLVTLLGAGTGWSRGRRRWRAPIAFGPAVAVSRQAYWSIGGHAGAAGAIDDDLALARAADAAGVPVAALLGGDLIRYRMYPDGIAPLVEGWSKNLAVGAGAIPRLRLAATVAWVAVALSVAGTLAWSPSPVAALAYGAFALQAHVVLRRCGQLWPAAWAYPLALAAFLGLFARSVLLTRGRRSVRWRGRDISLERVA